MGGKGSQGEAVDAYLAALDSPAKGNVAADEVLSSDDQEEMDSSLDTNRRREEALSRKEEADADRLEGENKLRDKIGKSALRFVWLQLIASDILMAVYIIGTMWTGGVVPENAIIGWLTATVVEIIGVLWVIARSLFPFRDEHRNKDGEKPERRGAI